MSKEVKSNLKLMRPGMAVIILSGRYAGRKAVVIKNYDDGSSKKPYGHALVAGIDRYPRRVLRKMSQKRIDNRSKIKPFVKLVNYNHLMPTRHTVNIQFNTNVLNKNCLADKQKKRLALLDAKLKFQERIYDKKLEKQIVEQVIRSVGPGSTVGPMVFSPGGLLGE
nr:60S ribosomal protein L27 [Hymenolepis microstoma]